MRAKEFGAALARSRQRADLSQAALGALLGIPQTTISSWERGESRPYADTVFEIEKALDLEPGTLSQVLGFLPLDIDEPSDEVEAAIVRSPTLDSYRKGLLRSIYRTMVDD